MNADEIKEMIIGQIITTMKCDADALFVCDCIEKIADKENTKSVVKSIRNGKITITCNNNTK